MALGLSLTKDLQLSDCLLTTNCLDCPLLRSPTRTTETKMKRTISTLALAALFTFQACHAFTVHEWGTFTQVLGSDGTVLDGLEREEERLPAFVYGHAGLENGGTSNPSEKIIGLSGFRKGLNRPVHGVNTKMETPVIYFYADEPLQAKVEVEWKGGAISQWYPQRSGGESPPALTLPFEAGALNSGAETPAFAKAGGIDFTKNYEGSITWDVAVSRSGDYDQADLFKGNETTSWLYPRIPGTSLLTSGSESESYLFYRGIGRIETGLSFSVDSSNTLSITNNTKDQIPFLMVFQNNFLKISTRTLTEGLSDKETVTIDLTQLKEEGQSWQPSVYRQMRQGLVAAGLFEAEAEAMIQTWWRSYFATPSYGNTPRVFWVMPASQVDDILPLTITPRPEKLTRVLVGRAEILTPAVEKELLALDRNPAGVPLNLAHDRFAKAYTQRIKQLTTGTAGL